MSDRTEPTPDSGLTPDLRIEYAAQMPDAPPQPRVIVQSFTCTCHITVTEGNEEPVPPVWDFKPSGEGITPDDCIALATRGIQWVLQERARIGLEHHRRQQEAQQAQEQRVIRVEPHVPGVTEGVPVPPELIPPRRIIRPGEH